MSRPTWAQVSAVEQLLDLVILCEDATAIVTDAGRVALREITDSANILIPLVDGDETWIDVALAYDAEAAALLRRMLRKALT